MLHATRAHIVVSWLTSWKRRRLLARPFPAQWDAYLDSLPFYRGLDRAESDKLKLDLRVLVTEKYWEGSGGLRMTDEIKVVVSAQASLLILNLTHEYYRRVRTILVYPAAFVVPAHAHGEKHGASGLAWSSGQVVLSWDDAHAGGKDPSDGRNLVYHEFAHALDMLDGFADGAPPLASSTQYEAWHRVVGSAFEDLARDLEQGAETPIDPYGATNPTEFFAVVTECFFERPAALKSRHPELYALLCEIYRQDPGARPAADPGRR